MLISNFNLYKSEWLELVFEKRNKEYGAYYIRQHYSNTIVKAMAITFVSVVSAVILVGIAIRVKPITDKYTEVPEMLLVAPPVPPKADIPKPKPLEAKPSTPKQAPAVNTTRFVPPVVVPGPVEDELPKIDEMKGAVGPVEIKNAGDGMNAGEGVDKGGAGIGKGENVENNTVVLAPDVLPEPIGGAAAWAKFLQNTLRYPREAIDKEMGGRVYVSFVVEKDGHLSSIVVERGAGFGMDEEAARVLKLAKAWKPGLQAGRPVRVKYTLPVVFTVSE